MLSRGIRITFVGSSTIACYLMSHKLIIALIGFVVALLLVICEVALHVPRYRKFVTSAVGLAIGLLISLLFLTLLNQIYTGGTNIFYTIIYVFIVLGVGYFGMFCGYYLSESTSVLRFLNAYRHYPQGTSITNNNTNGFKLLDTSVIIDGRILEICETQFIDGTILIPRFVLNELQHIADSTEILRKNKGRRGFDILSSLQNNPMVPVQIIEEDVTHLTEVDEKLVHLARKYSAKIITNDLNLNKVAELQGVIVLNINELANAIRPIVVAGEIIQVHLQKVGKEHNQGIGYLDDGTMVIVEDGKSYIGQTIEVIVTQMLRTSTGQMIFARNVKNGWTEKGIR